jgi:hypothetical protein
MFKDNPHFAAIMASDSISQQYTAQIGKLDEEIAALEKGNDPDKEAKIKEKKKQKKILESKRSKIQLTDEKKASLFEQGKQHINSEITRLEKKRDSVGLNDAETKKLAKLQ